MINEGLLLALFNSSKFNEVALIFRVDQMAHGLGFLAEMVFHCPSLTTMASISGRVHPNITLALVYHF